MWRGLDLRPPAVLCQMKLRGRIHDCSAKMAQFRQLPDIPVIIPFLMGYKTGLQAAAFSFIAGVMPPMAMLGRSLLYVHSQRVA